jgi:hypothetical protein
LEKDLAVFICFACAARRLGIGGRICRRSSATCWCVQSATICLHHCVCSCSIIGVGWRSFSWSQNPLDVTGKLQNKVIDKLMTIHLTFHLTASLPASPFEPPSSILLLDHARYLLYDSLTITFGDVPLIDANSCIAPAKPSTSSGEQAKRVHGNTRHSYRMWSTWLSRRHDVALSYAHVERRWLYLSRRNLAIALPCSASSQRTQIGVEALACWSSRQREPRTQPSGHHDRYSTPRSFPVSGTSNPLDRS